VTDNIYSSCDETCWMI